MATGSFPRARAFFPELAHPVLPLGARGGGVLVTLLRLARPGDGISSPLHSPRLHAARPSWGGTRMGLLGTCPRLFPWFLWEKIQKKTESVQAEREGGGGGPGPAGRPAGEAPGVLGSREVPLQPRPRFCSPWALPERGWRGWRPLRLPGPHIPGLQAKCSFMEPRESDPPRRLARSQAGSTEPACHSRTGQKSRGSAGRIPTSSCSSIPAHRDRPAQPGSL